MVSQVAIQANLDNIRQLSVRYVTFLRNLTMKNAVLGLSLVALLVIIGTGWYFLRYQDPVTDPVVERQPVPEPPAEPAPLYPVPEPSVVQDAPEDTDEQAEPQYAWPTAPVELDASDPYMIDMLRRFFPTSRLEDFFILNNLIKRIVATVDNLPRRELPARLVPLRPVPGIFEVEGSDNNLVISEKNTRRYLPLVNLFSGIETRRLVSVYVHLYPLFQQAYRDLGYPKGHFNDRLVYVIDHLLAAPQISGPVRVQEHVVRYRFADPGLEALSSGEKIMIRIGPDHARKVRDKLREIRRDITNLHSI